MAGSSTAGDHARTRQIMSLDFIAPADRVPESRPARDSGNVPQLQARRSWAAAQVTDPARSKSTLGRQDSCWDESAHSSPRSATLDLGSPTFSPDGIMYSDSARQLARRREDDRHNYDEEEKYAILHFRIERGEKWSDILKFFGLLFPVGQPRRRPGKTLTEAYVERRKGGLECRYYRLREDHGFKQLRSPAYDLEDDRQRLAQLFRTFQLSEKFLVCLRGL